MGSDEFLILVLLIVEVLVASCGEDGRFVLNLERAFPVDMKVEIDRDRARHARMLGSFDGGVVDFPVTGSFDPNLAGIYFTKVKLGSPPREFNVQIDTGSDILWVTCSSCKNCPRTSGLGVDRAFFDAARSSSASIMPCSDTVCSPLVPTASAACITESNECGYSFQYGDGSATSGYYISDLFHFDTVISPSVIANSSAPIVFGCSTSQSGDLTESDRAVDGIFGFGQQPLSVISQLSSRGITPKIFSHCLKGDGNGGGILVLGEILDPRIVYSPLVPSQPHYNLYLESITVNGQVLPIDQTVFTSENRGTIVDSGTTLTYLVEEAYEPFVNAITASVSQSVKPLLHASKQCYLVSTSISQIFPSVSFNFAGDASLALRPSDYLMHKGIDGLDAIWCIGFEKVQGDGVTILGDLVLKDKIFVYDLAQRRIGWADYDCSLPVNVSITSGKDEFINANQLSKRSSSSCLICKSKTNLLLQILAFIGFAIL